MADITNKHIIGVIGYAGSGKDAVGKILTSKHGYRRAAFGDPVKKAALNLGWDGKKDTKGRKLLQLLGTDLCRNCIDEEYWLKRIVISDYTVVTDVRFANEAELILSLGGKLVLIDRAISKPKWWEFLFIHKSERYASWIKDYPHTIIDNNGTLEELEKKCLTLL